MADAGEVLALFVTPEPEGPVKVVERIEAVAGRGVEGDHHFGVTRRQVLLIESEALEHFGLAPGQVHENVTVRGLKLAGLPDGAQVAIGDSILLQVTGDCEPCSFIEGLRPGLRADIEGQRGTLARVLSGGSIRPGDSLRVTVPADAMVAGLAATLDRLDHALTNATEAQLDYTTGPAEWPARKVLAHLLDGERNVMRLRVERMLAEDEPRLEPYSSPAEYWSSGGPAPTLADLWESFREERERSLSVFRGLDGAGWRRSGLHPTRGRITVESWTRFWLEHDHEHMSQIKAMLRRARREKGK